MLRNKGFTLVEILAVIVILSILLLLAVPAITKQINRAKKISFFNSVSNIVNSLKPIDTLEENEYCIYNYKGDKNNQNNNIEQLYVILNRTNNKNIYIVYAFGNDTYIDVDDFNKLSTKSIDNWNQSLATEKLMQLIDAKGFAKTCYVSSEGSE